MSSSCEQRINWKTNVWTDTESLFRFRWKLNLVKDGNYCGRGRLVSLAFSPRVPPGSSLEPCIRSLSLLF